MRGVSFCFGHRPVVDEVDLDIYEHDFLGIVGPNGGGKTTLLKILLGLIAPHKGTVKVLGMSPADARTRLGYVPQYASFAMDVPVTVNELVMTGRLGHARLGRRYSALDREVTARVLEEMSLTPLAGREIRELSGGERQRVLVARALACEPEMLILDEPTANIDVTVERAFHERLMDLNKRIPIVLVSHDLGFISAYLTRVVLMSGKLKAADVGAVHAHDLEDIYAGPVKQLRRDEHDH
jgi:zinc transport system ATP-binding protein